MAKDKADKAHKAGKSAKTKIPKQIAGIKIPKALRESGKAAIKLSQDPAARELLSAGLMAAATAIAANSQAREAAMDGGQQAKDAMGEAVHSASDSATKIGAALIGAANLAAQRFFKLDEQNAAAQDRSEVSAGTDAAEAGNTPGEAPRETAPSGTVRKTRVKPAVPSEGSAATPPGLNGKV